MESKYGKYIVQELKTKRFTPEFKAMYATFANRILWMDDQVVDGAFQMNCSWYLGPNPPESPERFSHTHDADEIIGFFGSNPKAPYDLTEKINFDRRRKDILTRTTNDFVPGGWPIAAGDTPAGPAHFPLHHGDRWSVKYIKKDTNKQQRR